MAKKHDEAVVLVTVPVDEFSTAVSPPLTAPTLNGQEHTPPLVPDGRVLKSHPLLDVSFTLPEKMTVREQLSFRARVNNYHSAAGGEVDDDGNPLGDPADLYLAYWEAGKRLIQDWQSPLLADPAALDVDEETSPAIATTVIWTANTVAGHINNIGGELVPKN